MKVATQKKILVLVADAALCFVLPFVFVGPFVTLMIGSVTLHVVLMVYLSIDCLFVHR